MKINKINISQNKKAEFYCNHDNKLVLVFWPKLATEEASVAIIREMFEESGYRTDRIWNETQKKKEQPLGVRIYLPEPRPIPEK